MTERNRHRNDDEALSALLDGELSEEEAARLRSRVADDPALASRLGRLERADARVHDAYAAIATEPLPRRLAELLREEGPRRESGRAGSGKLLRFPLGHWQTLPLPAAAAAVIALAVGLLIGFVVGRGPAAPDGPALFAGPRTIEPGSRLHQVLERVPSATMRELGAGVAAVPRLTLRTGDGNYCRQVDLASPTGHVETLACRRAGEWQLEVVAFSDQAPPADGRYRPAAGTTTAIASAIGSMIDGAPLGREAERALIAGQWGEETR